MARSDFTRLVKCILASQKVRFVLVGMLNTLFGYSIYALGILLGLDHRIALGMSTVLGVLFNFRTTGRIVFTNSSVKNAFFRYVLMYVAMYALNVVILDRLIALGAGELLGQCVALPFVVVCTYIVSKYWVFR